MRFSRPVLDACTAAFTAVLPLENPADSTLSAFFRAHPKIGRQDRATIAESVFAALRRRRLLERVAGTDNPRRLVLATWTALLGANLREIDPWLRGDEAEWLGAVKRGTNAPQPFEVECDLPDWVIERLRPRFGDAALLELAKGLLEVAPLDLRVNSTKSARDVVIERLAEDGLHATATPYSPDGVRLQGKPAINRHPLFLDGSVEIQDEGSQLLCYLVAPKRGEMVVDFCAGAGGKTLALGALMRSTGRLYAFDVSPGRIAKLKPRLARSGLSNVHPQRIERTNDARVKRLAGKIDRVLVDAPCSGFGDAASQSGHEVAANARRRRGTGGKAKGDSFRSGAARKGRREARLCHLQHSRGGKSAKKVAHAVEQQHVGMFCLDAQVLLHHRGVGRFLWCVHAKVLS